MHEIGILALAVFGIGLALRIPIGFSLGISALITLSVTSQGIPLIGLPHKLINSLDSFPIMAVPFFILAGELMNEAGITERILRFSGAIVGSFRGGLAMTNCVANFIMGGVSGSMIADEVAIGKIIIPAMVKRGYSAGFAAGLTASAAIAGPIVPPSIPMVIYGVVAGVSVGALFMGGFIPGAIAIAGLMITSYLICRKRSYDPPQPFSMARLVMETRKGIWAIIMPPFIIGGIVVGIFTPTEAAAAAVAYSLFCGLVIYRQLTFRAIVDAGVSAGRITALTLVIFAFCQVFTWVLMAHNIPQAVTQLLLRISNNPYVILFVLNVLMLIMGCFLDPLSGILIVVPMVMETIQILNISPIHFGVMMVFNLCIGNLTPPVGFALYVAQDLAKLTLEETIKSVMPFLCVLIGVLLIITYIPASITWLPQLAGM